MREMGTGKINSPSGQIKEILSFHTGNSVLGSGTSDPPLFLTQPDPAQLDDQLRYAPLTY
jgi:hypothetical protein